MRAFIADHDAFAAVFFEFMRGRKAADEPFVIVHSEPFGDSQRHLAKFATAEALAEFDRFWREASHLGQVVRTLAA